jgi:hypothetical protein
MANPQIDYNGNQVWRDENGKNHRDDGPAVIYSDGRKFWFQHGKRHRTDGPAIIYPNGHVSWCLEGHYYEFEGWLELLDISDESKVMMKLKHG